MRRLEGQGKQRAHACGRAGARALACVGVGVGLLAAAALAPPAEAQGRHFFGVATQAPGSAGHLAPVDYNRMRRGRVGTLRFLFTWRNIETRPGHYSWAGPDRIIGDAAARGIRLLPFTYSTPEHISNPPTTPAARRAFRRFMEAAARRYGPRGSFWRGPFQQRFPHANPRPIRTWQIHNEQNGRFHWGRRPSPRAYGRLVIAGSRGVRSVNRRAEIVLGGMFGTPSGGGSLTSWRFLNRLYGLRGIRRAFDTVAVHPYAPNLRGVRMQMRRVRKVMRRNNDRAAGMRVTEIGWGSARGNHSLLKGPKGQARMLRRSLRLMARQRHERDWKVRGVNWFSWQDGSAGCPFCASSGLFAGPPDARRAKPAWEAFRRMARRR